MSALGIGVLGATSMVYRVVIADAIAATDGVRIVHEASRSAEGPSADGIRLSRDYGSVLADDEVDLIYLPLPNHLHEEWVVASARAGKHVLCEKPLGITAESAERMVAACDDAGVRLLEAYMTPFHPRSQAVQQAVAEGVIGPPVHGEARMSGKLPADNHRWRVANGGGVLLDVGIYCLEPILTAFGWAGESPVEVAAHSTFAGDGVDATTSAWLVLPGGQTLHLWASFDAADQQRLQLTGPDGAIEVDRHATPDRRDDTYRLRDPDGDVREVTTGAGDCYEGLIAHTRDVVAGTAEPLHTLDRSLRLAQVTDAIAHAAGHHR